MGYGNWAGGGWGGQGGKAWGGKGGKGGGAGAKGKGKGNKGKDYNPQPWVQPGYTDAGGGSTPMRPSTSESRMFLK